jgi:hypothetical protein
MREFSQFEQNLIRNHLIRGAGLPGMLSNDFREKARLVIHFDPKGHTKFEYRSDDYESSKATEELVNIVDLLEYLLTEGFIRKYPPNFTSLREFDVQEQISLGESQSQKSQNFLLHDGSLYLPKFIMQTENYVFKATEPLRTLTLNDFQTAEERRHNQAMSKATNANRIALAVAVASIILPTVLGYMQYRNSYDELLTKLTIESAENDVLRKAINESNSLTNEVTKDVKSLKDEIETMKVKLNAKKEKKKL